MVGLLIAVGDRSAPQGRAGEPASTSSPAKASRRVTAFELTDVRGWSHSADDWREGRAKAVVLLFLGAECPVSNGYAPEMARLARAYGPRGVRFYGIYPDPDLSDRAAARHAQEFGLEFPVLRDPEQVVAHQAGVGVTPEAAVLAPDGRVLYLGRIDDTFNPQGRRRPSPTTRDLDAALRAVLDGKAPPAAAARAFGCPLPRPIASTVAPEKAIRR